MHKLPFCQKKKTKVVSQILWTFARSPAVVWLFVTPSLSLSSITCSDSIFIPAEARYLQILHSMVNKIHLVTRCHMQVIVMNCIQNYAFIHSFIHSFMDICSLLETTLHGPFCLTFWDKAKLSADNFCIIGIPKPTPGDITHCPPLSLVAHLHSTIQIFFSSFYSNVTIVANCSCRCIGTKYCNWTICVTIKSSLPFYAKTNSLLML